MKNIFYRIDVTENGPDGHMVTLEAKATPEVDGDLRKAGWEFQEDEEIPQYYLNFKTYDSAVYAAAKITSAFSIFASQEGTSALCTEESTDAETAY